MTESADDSSPSEEHPSRDAEEDSSPNPSSAESPTEPPCQDSDNSHSIIPVVSGETSAGPDSPVSEDATWLEADDFDESVASETAVARVRPPGPGLPESLLWMMFIVPAQMVGAVIAIVILLIRHGVQGGVDEISSLIANLSETNQVAIIGSAQLGFVLIVMAAATIRLGFSDAGRRLGLRAMSFRHFVLVGLIVFPVATFSGGLHWWTMRVWEQVVSHFPGLAWLDDIQSMKMLEEMATDASLPLLLLIIAVAPAIGEELICRGLIGRGLVARWGLVTGVGMTSMLFAILHVHPAHVVALLPLAVTIHVVYLATRSFWAPMLVHFLNNAWATVEVKLKAESPVPQVAQASPLPVGILLTSLLSALVLVWILWKTRLQFQDLEGNFWSPGYITAEHPPREVIAFPHRNRAGNRLLLLAFFCLLTFAFSVLRTEFSG